MYEKIRWHYVLKGKGLQQTFWLLGKTESNTVQPHTMERRNGICPQLYEAPDLTELNSNIKEEMDSASEVRKLKSRKYNL